MPLGSVDREKKSIVSSKSYNNQSNDLMHVHSHALSNLHKYHGFVQISLYKMFAQKSMIGVHKGNTVCDFNTISAHTAAIVVQLHTLPLSFTLDGGEAHTRENKEDWKLR